MKRKTEQMMKKLRAEKINTWFDLGLFLDRIREQRRSEVFETGLPFERFKRRLRRGGLAFITYHFLVDGVTFEVKKYAEAARGIFKNIPIHYIAAEILPEAQLSKQDKVAVIPEINGFDDWKLYRDFFFTKLKRGNKTYTDTLIEKRGHNPANVTEIGTAVDTENMFFNDERRKIRTLLQISRIFSDDGQKMKATAVGDYLRTLNGSKNPDPVLIGLTDIPSVEFVHNIIFIQPTRIIERKRIEFNFELVKKLLSHGDFSDYFRRNEQLTLTILVTGPIAD